MLVAKQDGPAMFARIGVMKEALNRRAERVFDSSEKDWPRDPIVSTATEERSGSKGPV